MGRTHPRRNRDLGRSHALKREERKGPRKDSPASRRHPRRGTQRRIHTPKEPNAVPLLTMGLQGNSEQRDADSAHALECANSPAYGCSLAWQNHRGVPNSPAGRRALDVASFLSHKSFSGGEAWAGRGGGWNAPRTGSSWSSFASTTSRSNTRGSGRWSSSAS